MPTIAAEMRSAKGGHAQYPRRLCSSLPQHIAFQKRRSCIAQFNCVSETINRISCCQLKGPSELLKWQFPEKYCPKSRPKLDNIGSTQSAAIVYNAAINPPNVNKGRLRSTPSGERARENGARSML